MFANTFGVVLILLIEQVASSHDVTDYINVAEIGMCVALIIAFILFSLVKSPEDKKDIK